MNAHLKRCVGVLGFALITLLPIAVGAPAIDNQDLIAMVRVERNGIVVDQGAGIVVYQSSERTIIATAYHVLRDVEGDENWKGNVSTEFLNQRGQFYPARYNSEFADKVLDLALLFIDNPAGSKPPPEVIKTHPAAVSPSGAQTLIGAPVTAIGYMNQKPWSISGGENRVVSGNPRIISFQPRGISGGASGGGLFDSLGRLVGMISRIQPGDDAVLGEAIPIAAISGRISSWGLKFDLQSSAAPTSTPELADQIDREFSVDSGYVAGTYFGNTGAIYLFKVSPPPGLIELKPRVSVEYNDGLDVHWELAGPKYVKEVHMPPVSLQMRVMFELVDGRKFGPFTRTIDFGEQPRKEALAKGPNDAAHIKIVAETWEKNRETQRSQIERLKAEQAATKAADEAVDNEGRRARIIEELSRSYLKWNVNCRLISEPGIKSWDCNKSGMPLANWSERNNLAESIFDEVHLGGDSVHLTESVPVTNSGLSEAFLAGVARVLSTEAKEVYVEVWLKNGQKLGPKRLCVMVERTRRCR